MLHILDITISYLCEWKCGITCLVSLPSKCLANLPSPYVFKFCLSCRLQNYTGEGEHL